LIIFILIVGGTVTSFLTYFESILISYRNYTSLAIWNPMGNITKLILLYLCNTYFSYPLGYLDILVIFSLSPVIILGFFFFLIRKIEFNWTGNIKSVMIRLKELSLFNLWAFLASIFAILSDRMELFFLKMYHNPEAVAVYGTTLQLFSGFVILFSTLNSLVLPRLSIAPNQTEFNRLLLKSFLMSLLVAVLLIPGYFLAEPILTILFINKYSESIPIFKILYPNHCAHFS
jgi:O-antigen/teichoic acid export membrane protein